MGVRVKYAILSVIGDKKATKTDCKYFIEKQSFLSYVRKYESKILDCRLWDTENDIRNSAITELIAAEWKITRPQKKQIQRKEHKEMIENHILHECRTKSLPITLFLANGFQLKGMITGYDEKVVMIATADGKDMMIYKTAISTIDLGRYHNITIK
jgi:host factor-I protein